MIGLDTNVLVRYYVADTDDDGSAAQQAAARRLIESGVPLMVCKTVMLELEWVLRGYYGFEPKQIGAVFGHLFALPHITVEDRSAVEAALQHYASGLDFADALHHAAYANCDSMASFDDRRFARRVKRMGLIPIVSVPR